MNIHLQGSLSWNICKDVKYSRYERVNGACARAKEQIMAELNEHVMALRAALPSRGRVLLIPHNHPDPDALASVMGMHLLLAKAFGLRSQIAFTGLVSRAENREFLRQARYHWRLFPDMRPPAGRVPAILVDTAPWAGNVTLPSYVRPVAVLDHHPLPRGLVRPDHLYLDIQPSVGATATLVYEFLRDARLTIPRWLSTLLVYAISSETLDFSRETTPRDLDAYTDLLRQANPAKLGKIRYAPLPRAYYARLEDAMRNARAYGYTAWTWLSEVDQPEIVAELADLLLRAERISWAFCLARMGDRLLISVRSSRPGARCWWVLRRVLGDNGESGGHAALAAGFHRLENTDPITIARARSRIIAEMLARITRRRPANLEAIVRQAQPLTSL